MPKRDIGALPADAGPGFRASHEAASASSPKASIPSAFNDILGPGGPVVPHEDALNAAHDLIAHFFRNEPRKNGGVLISIPVHPDNTDVLLIRYIRQQRARAALVATRLEQIRRLALSCEGHAFDLIEALAAEAASGTEARRAETSSGSACDGPTRQGDAHDQ